MTKQLTDAEVRSLADHLVKTTGITKQQALNQAREMQAETGDVVKDKDTKKV